MNKQIQIGNTGVDVQQYQQIQANKVSNALEAGMLLFEEKDVMIPISLNDGLADLKWLINGLLSGEFNINLDPAGKMVPAGENDDH